MNVYCVYTRETEPNNVIFVSAENWYIHECESYPGRELVLFETGNPNPGDDTDESEQYIVARFELEDVVAVVQEFDPPDWGEEFYWEQEFYPDYGVDTDDHDRWKERLLKQHETNETVDLTLELDAGDEPTPTLAGAPCWKLVLFIGGPYNGDYRQVNLNALPSTWGLFDAGKPVALYSPAHARYCELELDDGYGDSEGFLIVKYDHDRDQGSGLVFVHNGSSSAELERELKKILMKHGAEQLLL